MKKINIAILLTLFVLSTSKYRYSSHLRLKTRKSNNGHNNSHSKGTIVNNSNPKRMKKEGEELGTPFKFPETFVEIA